jgi:hypothetical protein
MKELDDKLREKSLGAEEDSLHPGLREEALMIDEMIEQLRGHENRVLERSCILDVDIKNREKAAITQDAALLSATAVTAKCEPTLTTLSSSKTFFSTTSRPQGHCVYPAFRGYILDDWDVKMDGPTNLGLQLQLRKLGV